MLRRFALLIGLSLLAATLAAPVAAAHGARSPNRIDLPAGFQPEGITSGKGSTIYVGSLADGSIWRGNSRTGAGFVFISGSPGLVAVGIAYEAAHDRLWVAGGATGAVRVYDAKTGSLIRSYQFAAGFLNDLAVTKRGVFVTDSGIQQLAVLPLGRKGQLPEQAGVRTMPLTGDLVYEIGFNANGITATKGWLILVQSNTGKLFRVNPANGRTWEIDLRGASVSAGDGIEVRGNRLYVVRNQLNRVAVFKLGVHLRSARLLAEISVPGFDVPTTATFSRGRLWVVNARFGTPPTPMTEYWITRVPRLP